ncbi:helix-turn-helix transcriptional regulator [Massilibacterium senegalense]|uniref:helix-turn-helix transcriptional regulator n=1 Tax=Massilibacterium senegalense TaxID=1632858 RepID=UPI0007856417|nr:helix-turn-helix transcriptional regulator [Massilibacterium senegalense]
MENKLMELRKEHNLSQEKLAEILKVSRQTVISIEKKRYTPSLKLAFKIANEFDKSIEEIFFYNQEDE